jgi:hypothetical protein
VTEAESELYRCEMSTEDCGDRVTQCRTIFAHLGCAERGYFSCSATAEREDGRGVCIIKLLNHPNIRFGALFLAGRRRRRFLCPISAGRNSGFSLKFDICIVGESQLRRNFRRTTAQSDLSPPNRRFQIWCLIYLVLRLDE